MNTFSKRHIGPNAVEKSAMLRTIGVKSIDELIDKKKVAKREKFDEKERRLRASGDEAASPDAHGGNFDIEAATASASASAAVSAIGDTRESADDRWKSVRGSEVLGSHRVRVPRNVSGPVLNPSLAGAKPISRADAASARLRRQDEKKAHDGIKGNVIVILS